MLLSSRASPPASCPVSLGARNVGDLLRGKPMHATLRLKKTFAHLGDLRDLRPNSFSRQAALVPERSAEHQPLCFYGAPGTGGAEFAKTLGARARFFVQLVGETIDRNPSPAGAERLAALLIASAIGAWRRRTILVVDEADDVFDAFARLRTDAAARSS